MINETCFVLDRQAEMDINMLAHASNSLQEDIQLYGLPRHIILTLGWPVFALAPKCCMLSGEAANTNFNVFALTQPGIEPTTFCTRGKHA